MSVSLSSSLGRSRLPSRLDPGCRAGHRPQSAACSGGIAPRPDRPTIHDSRRRKPAHNVLATGDFCASATPWTDPVTLRLLHPVIPAPPFGALLVPVSRTASHPYVWHLRELPPGAKSRAPERLAEPARHVLKDGSGPRIRGPKRTPRRDQALGLRRDTDAVLITDSPMHQQPSIANFGAIPTTKRRSAHGSDRLHARRTTIYVRNARGGFC